MKHEFTFPCEVESIYDGDTLKLKVDLGFGLKHHISARLDGIDTPELRGGSDLTKAAARLARDAARAFIEAGTQVIFRPTVWAGKYGRPVGEVIVDGVSLRDWLIERRHGLPYAGGTSRAGWSGKHEIEARYHRDRGALAEYGIPAPS